MKFIISILGLSFFIILIFNYQSYGRSFINETTGDSAHEYCMKESLHVKMLSSIKKKSAACDCTINKISISVKSGLDSYQFRIALKKTTLGLLFPNSQEKFLSYVSPKIKGAAGKCALNSALQ